MIKYFLVEKYEKKRANKNSILYLEYEGTSTSEVFRTLSKLKEEYSELSSKKKKLVQITVTSVDLPNDTDFSDEDDIADEKSSNFAQIPRISSFDANMSFDIVDLIVWANWFEKYFDKSSGSNESTCPKTVLINKGALSIFIL